MYTVVKKMSVRLKTVTKEDLEEVEAFKSEMIAANSSMDGTGGLQGMNDINEWYQKLLRYSNADVCPKDKSPSTQYLIMDNEKLVGMLDIRHNLNHPMLKLFGGHIGYCVRPSERQKGYAKEGLRLALIEAGKLNIEKVMISCLIDNTASRKTILSNGGIFDHDVYVEDRDETVSIFFIDTK